MSLVVDLGSEASITSKAGIIIKKNRKGNSFSTMTSPATLDDLETPTASLIEPLLQHESPLIEVKEDAVSLISDPRDVDIEQVSFDEEVQQEHWEQGESQPSKYQNITFAILFLMQVGVVLFFAIKCIISISRGVGPYKPNGDVASHLNIELLYFHLATALAAILLSCGTLALFGAKAGFTIRVALLASPMFLIVSGFVVVFSTDDGVSMGLMMMVGGLFGLCYAKSVWHRIPFAASNLATAVTAVKANLGLFVVAYAVVFLTIGWTLLWFLALGHAYIRGYFTECDDADEVPEGQEPECHISTGGYFFLFFFLLSLYWTSQVLKNILHSTVAGVVGTWWFVPPVNVDDNHTLSCCSQRAIGDSLWRSTTYSFGSLCLGSLVVALIQVLQFIIRLKRGQEEERRHQTSLVWCLIECLVNQLERLLKFINKWAFVYVGLYGYDYFTAGSKVYQLFQARGWSVIINDHVLSRTLGMMGMLTAICSGMVAMSINACIPSWLDIDSTGGSSLAFGFGFLYGFMIVNVLISVLSSAVDTCVVCFAEAPNEFRVHHPVLAANMMEAWRKAYPAECGF